ncbi:MAG TPA: ornithine carbamoyltransferase [Terriglobales bacterium]|nr:ornithine carbamoyltransferase [Terriglobales bacterium]
MNSQPFSPPRLGELQGPKEFWSRDLVSVRDFSPSEVDSVLDLTALMKARPVDFRATLAGKQLVMFFEKPSLRTRLTFESGMASLGGVSFFVDQTQGQLGIRETLSDVAHNVERWCDVIVLRTYAHATVEDVAQNADIPVINALSEREHPCQALADYFTLQEKFGDLRKVRLAYVGDGNNVANSLLLVCASLGSTIRLATPEGYGPDAQILADAQEIARETGAKIELFQDPLKAVRGADAIYTDTWVSMGQEAESEERSQIFASYQVNEKLMAKASSHAVFMHCLPAYRGKEVTHEVIDSPRAMVFDQAENRLHVQKAVLSLLLGGGVGRFPMRSAHA